LGWGYRHSYHGHCGGNACDSDGCDSCGTGNCDTDGATSDGPGNTASDRVMNEKVISDRPVDSEPAGESAGPAPEPVPDKSTSHARGSAFRLTGMKQDRPGLVEFNKGVASYRARELNEALAAFEAAIAAEPDVAIYHYYLAMTLFGLSGAEAGQEALGRAVELEQREPITDWGKRMQREQGRARAWVEKARRDAGIVK
jgi:tetratricopeptide (TPR) repeat protein